MFSGALDSYSLTARIAPSVLLIAPVVLTVAGMFPSLFSGAQLAWSVGIAFASLFLVAQFVRDAGKRAERRLVAKWGGLPTVLMLRHHAIEGRRDVKDLHSRVQRVASCTLPSVEEEQADLVAADARYASAVVALRERTRAASEFPTVASANAVYGFRRNIRGAKAAGLCTSGASFTVSLGVLLNRHNYLTTANPVALAAALLVSAGLAIGWLWMFDDEWVRIAADDYAAQLFDSTARPVI
ncbi:MAG: hypothetical protein AB1762_20040 [Gemmatimonadota bacterium]